MRAAFYALALTASVALAIWLAFFAPCEIYSFSPCGRDPRPLRHALTT